MSKYPRDEFDAVEENSARYGVHRASMETQSRSLLPMMIVGVAALCIGLLAFFLMPKVLNNNSSPNAGKTSTAASAPASVPASEPPAPATSEPAPEPTPEPTPEAVVDKAVPVAVFNAAGVAGLAARYSDTITADGWTVAQAANWAGVPQATSVIYYSDPAQKDNAAALGALLNIPTQVESAELGLQLAVVLGPGAQ
ncbi:hypothetical protein JOF48_000728 [Arthrobacter stackebrandtii]|uniref:LytR/CpsA/Psr regulator C-terminal domain-containing protein n=1 Tax=Arthrobacter stackebrandtii TaxID=272161 RepID=A0ABS4YT64_9MICC|nr:LytR C-terminal domain-containing protein [Arthrobacter stackebrandtii]MBP2411929.1 hypothetical protein [Arthrobacter stackebrandtii]PYG99808.1 hypothetical protein CVV67_13720 [Arthrobacter stackebrandtii]